MTFPSELPAMRRQILPAPHPLAATLAWGGLAYAIASAILVAPLPHALSGNVIWPSAGVAGAGPLAAAAIAIIAPALILGLLARHASPVWPAARMAAAYLAMIGVVTALHVSGTAASARSLAGDCCMLSRL
jgi:hypothetical protein